MAIEKTIELNVDSNGAQADFGKLADAIQELNKSFSKFSENTTDGLEDIKSGAEKTTKGVGAIGKTLKSIGSGAGVFLILTKAFEFFKEVGQKNQKVLDLFNTTFEVLSIAFNDFFNFIFENSGGVIDTFKAIFNDPAQAIKDLGKTIYDGVVVRFQELIEVLGLAGKAIGQLVTGQFSAAFETIKEAGKQTIDVVTGVDDSFDSTVETIKNYATETVKAAKSNVELAKQSELAMVMNQGLIESYDRQSELLRQTRDDESKSIDERIKANEELAKVLDEQEKTMLSNAAISVKRAKVELDKNKENIELQVAYQEALNEQAGIEAQITGFRSEQQTNTNALLREQKDIQNELALIGKSERDIQRTELLQQYDLQKELIDRQVSDETEKNNLLLEAKTSYDEQLLELNNQFDEQDLAAQTEKQAAEEALRQKTRDELLAEKEAKAQIQLASIGVAEKGIAIGKQLAGKNKDVQKALLIAENAAGIAKILINTGVANAKAVATSPITGGQPWVAINSISAGLGIAGSIAATAKGLSALGGGSAGSKPNAPSGSGGGGSAPAPPSFNVVGASETSVLADTVAEQTNEPVQAYVVSNDVTTAQSMENNIVEGATI